MSIIITVLVSALAGIAMILVIDWIEGGLQLLLFEGRRVRVAGRSEIWIVIRKHGHGVVELESEGNPLHRIMVPRDELRPRWER